MPITTYPQNKAIRYVPSEEEVSQGLFDINPQDEAINKKFMGLSESAKPPVEQQTAPTDDEATQLIKELPKDRPPTPEQKESLKEKLGSMLEGENYINYTLPILGIVEAIATQGKSPGTTALTMQSKAREAREHGLTMEERRAQMAESAEGRRSKTLARKNEEMMRNELNALPWDSDPEGSQKKAAKIAMKYGTSKDILSFQSNLERIDAMSKKNKEIFDALPPNAQKQVEAIARRRALGIDNPNQYIKDFPAFGKNGSIRAVVDNLTYEINPDFNAYEAELKWGARSTEEKAKVGLTKEIIEKRAGQRYAQTTAGEQAQRDIQKTNPMLSGESAIKVSQAAMAIKNLNRLKEELEKGNVDYFDIIKKTGQFKNPKVNNAFQQVSEIVGRQQSGAAIANHEWANFGKEILNRNFLLTEEGRKTALENIEDYLDRFYSVGTLQTSDEDWYKKYIERAQKARSGEEKVSFPNVSQGTKIINGITYVKGSDGLWHKQQ